MIIVCNRIPVKPAYAEAFELAFQKRASLVDGMPGFIAFQLLAPTKPSDPYIVMTFWESQEDFQGWTQSAEFKEGHAQSGRLPQDAFESHPKIEVHEVVQSTLSITKVETST